MKHEALYHPGIKKDLENIDKKMVENFFNIVSSNLAVKPYTGKKLKGKYLNLWRIKVGKFRIIYEIENKGFKIFILRFGHRQNIYDSFY